MWAYFPFSIQFAQLKQRHHFIQTRQRKTQQLLDVFLIKQSSPLRDLCQNFAVCRTKSLERKARVHLVRKQARAAKLFHFNQSIADFYVETVRQRVGRIRGEKKNGIVALELIEKKKCGG